jgi:hypothetical protein
MPISNAATRVGETGTQVDLEEELRQAASDFACGDFVELTVAQLDRSLAAGEWPWPSESSG